MERERTVPVVFAFRASHRLALLVLRTAAAQNRTPSKLLRELVAAALARIIHEGADSSRDTKASAWYKAVATRAFSHTEAFDCATTPYHRLFSCQTSSSNPSLRHSISPTRARMAVRSCSRPRKRATG